MAADSESSKVALRATIRKLAISDVPAVLAILQESPEAAAWSKQSFVQLASVETTAWVADVTGAGSTWSPPGTGAGCTCSLPELSGVLAGFLIGRIAADEFEILNMAVSPAHRRSGIGSKLLESALKYSRNAGTVRAYLEVRASNGPAIALYTHRGFTESGRRARYYQNPVEDAKLLSLFLGVS